MKCPHCKKETKIEDYVFINVETYRHPQLTVTECCGKAVMVYNDSRFIIEPYKGERKTDNWGKPIKSSLTIKK